MSYRMKLLIVFLLFVLTGCNLDNENTTPETNDDPVEKDEAYKHQSTIEEEEGEPFPFSQFELNIEYPNNQSYEVDYKKVGEEITAEIRDPINTEDNQQGMYAYHQLQPFFEQLTFDKTTSEEAVISEVIKVFNVNDDFISFALNVEFTDGEEKQYEVMNE
ncbi:YusW family protein [Caldibacillus lycopersici]|uniref:YusW family protein n=1 Tax=Perspicuibacillus lycopersici TaxID=1325689 RepID=A0AAE3IUH3_9BACI|nr:YusW family protein [Perspicuibacillus lycopersici]MCU9612300.1 YusW family protein [Perspicuibacillus lycopersici]